MPQNTFPLTPGQGSRDGAPRLSTQKRHVEKKHAGVCLKDLGQHLMVEVRFFPNHVAWRPGPPHLRDVWGSSYPQQPRLALTQPILQGQGLHFFIFLTLATVDSAILEKSSEDAE